MTDLDRDEVRRLNEVVGRALGWRYSPVWRGWTSTAVVGHWPPHHLPPADVVFGDVLSHLTKKEQVDVNIDGGWNTPWRVDMTNEPWGGNPEFRVNATARADNLRLAIMRVAAEVLG